MVYQQKEFTVLEHRQNWHALIISIIKSLMLMIMMMYFDVLTQDFICWIQCVCQIMFHGAQSIVSHSNANCYEKYSIVTTIKKCVNFSKCECIFYSKERVLNISLIVNVLFM